jgi:hypothetical protein
MTSRKNTNTEETVKVIYVNVKGTAKEYAKKHPIDYYFDGIGKRHYAPNGTAIDEPLHPVMPNSINARNNRILKRLGIKGLILKHKLRKLGFDMSRWRIELDTDNHPCTLILNTNTTQTTTGIIDTLAHLHYTNPEIYEDTYTSYNSSTHTEHQIHTHAHAEPSLTITFTPGANLFNEIVIKPTTPHSTLETALKQKDHQRFLKDLNANLAEHANIQKITDSEPPYEDTWVIINER